MMPFMLKLHRPFVPAKAGTQGQAAGICCSGFSPARE